MKSPENLGQAFPPQGENQSEKGNKSAIEAASEAARSSKETSKKVPALTEAGKRIKSVVDDWRAGKFKDIKTIGSIPEVGAALRMLGFDEANSDRDLSQVETESACENVGGSFDQAEKLEMALNEKPDLMKEIQEVIDDSETAKFMDMEAGSAPDNLKKVMRAVGYSDAEIEDIPPAGLAGSLKLQLADRNAIFEESKEEEPALQAEKPESKQEAPKTQEEVMSEIAELFKSNRIDQIVIHGGKTTTKIEGEKKEEFTELHPDFDARTALYLLNECNKRAPQEIYAEGAMTSVIPKTGSTENLMEKGGLRVFIDAGGDWLKIEKDNKTTTVHIDHHGAGKREPTSASKMMYEIMDKADLLKGKPDWLKNFVGFVNEFDNLTYLDKQDEKGRKIFDERYFVRNWPYTFYALAEKIPFDSFLGLCKSGKVKNLSVPLTSQQLAGDIGKIKTENGDLLKRVPSAG